MKIIQLEQGSPEWLEFRQNKIGASDAPIILNISPYSKPMRLWGQKVGLLPPTPSNPFMERGTRLEPEARSLFNEIMGMEFIPQVGVSDEFPWMSASFDGICEDSILEIKCNGGKNHTMASNGIVPPAHMAQLQHQLFVSGVSLAYYYSFDGIDGVTIRVSPDKEYIQNLIAKELVFWHHVINLEPPD